MDLIKVESEALTASMTPRSYRFASATWSIVVASLLAASSLPATLKEELASSYFNVFDDLRFNFLKEAAIQCSAVSTSEHSAGNLLSLLELITSMPSEPSHLNRFLTTSPEKLAKLQSSGTKRGKKRKRKDAADSKPADNSTGIFDASSEEEEVPAEQNTGGKLHDLLSVKAHRRVFQQCWMALFPLLKTEDQIKRVLLIMHQSIVPHMQNPASMMDFLSDCCRHGGTIALLALNGLYQLIIKYNLCVRFSYAVTDLMAC
jgi:U3 small nucleolar RNA-associated protein 19